MLAWNPLHIGSAMKNVTLVEYKFEARTRYKLIGPAGEIRAFEAFENLHKNTKHNTYKNYCHWLAKFIDYYIDAAFLIAGKKNIAIPDREGVVEIIDAYIDYLLFAGESDNKIAKQVAEVNPSLKVSPKSAEAMLAPVRKFLELSKIYADQLEQLGNSGVIAESISAAPIYKPMRAKPKPGQISEMQVNSMMSGVLAGGPGLLKVQMLPSHFKSTKNTSVDEAAFPFDLVIPLLKCFKTSRDRALFAFQAASGCRISESLQLTWEDIDSRGSRVKLVNPHTRINSDLYKSLSQSELLEKLSWKNRATERTLLIEPFASEFWKYLSNYIEEEYRSTEPHRFVFIMLKKEHFGRPMAFSSSASISEIFRNAVKRLYAETGDERLDEVEYGSHSLRHTYGRYLLNYFPHENGSSGLPIMTVMHLMGHKSEKTTQKYAIPDIELLEAEAAGSISRLYGVDSMKKEADLKREVLISKLNALKSDMPKR